MDFEQLKTFVSLANSRNFTRTAEELNVVQSTVTARIKLLEEEIGEKLFLRKTRNVEITNAGKVFLTYAKQTLELMSEGIRSTRIQSSYTTSLVIGAMNSLWDTPIFDQINDYQTNNPNTTIRLITGHSKDIIEKMNFGLIDIGFVYTPIQSSTFNIYKIREENIYLVGCTELVKSLSPFHSKDIKNIPYIHYNWGTEFSKWFDTEIGKHSTIRYRVDHTGIALRLLLKGEGIGFMLGSIIKDYESMGLIKQMKMDTTIPSRNVYMIVSKEKEERHRQFLEYMKEKNHVDDKQRI